MPHPPSNNAPAVTLYALHSCTHCKEAKTYLENLKVPFRIVYVDMLLGAERNDSLRHLRHINPSVSFPTLTIGETVVIGFKREEIDRALEG